MKVNRSIVKKDVLIKLSIEVNLTISYMVSKWFKNILKTYGFANRPLNCILSILSQNYNHKTVIFFIGLRFPINGYGEINRNFIKFDLKRLIILSCSWCFSWCVQVGRWAPPPCPPRWCSRPHHPRSGPPPDRWCLRLRNCTPPTTSPPGHTVRILRLKPHCWWTDDKHCLQHFTI